MTSEAFLLLLFCDKKIITENKQYANPLNCKKKKTKIQPNKPNNILLSL